MKRIFLLTILCFLSGVGLSYGQNPIPSYNAPVLSVANFQEGAPGFDTEESTRGKRTLIVHSNGGTSSTATVYVYSLDLQTIYGPFTLDGGQTLYINIDTREWGVLVESDDHITVDVWIEEDLLRSPTP